jgi:peptide/nickel transport system permease protein
LIPNTVGYIVVNAAFGMVGAMLTEAGLSYLGLGVTPPVPTWGNLINAATDPYNLQYRFWLWVIPGIFLFLTVLSINLIGEGLRDAFDPKEQG